jgi:hypothetical protein
MEKNLRFDVEAEHHPALVVLGAGPGIVDERAEELSPVALVPIGRRVAVRLELGR